MLRTSGFMDDVTVLAAVGRIALAALSHPGGV